MPHLHEAKSGDLLLLHSQEHKQHGLFCKLLRLVETDLGLGHLEQLSQHDTTDELSAQAEAQPLHLAAPALAVLVQLLLGSEKRIEATVDAFILTKSLLLWGGSRRGPPAVAPSFC